SLQRSALSPQPSVPSPPASKSTRRRVMPAIRRLAAAGVVTAALVGLTAAPALAHVSVESTDATQGGIGAITFRVPTESDTASTTKVTVQLPTDSPIASVS